MPSVLFVSDGFLLCLCLWEVGGRTRAAETVRERRASVRGEVNFIIGVLVMRWVVKRGVGRRVFI